MIVQEIEQPTTWTDKNGCYHELVSNPDIGPRLSGRAMMIAQFEKTGKLILESYGISNELIEEIKTERPSVLCELQTAIRRVIEESLPGDHKKNLNEAINICFEPGASRKLQRIFAKHRWPLIKTNVSSNGDCVRVEMLIESQAQWKEQVFPRLEAIIEETEITHSVTPRAVLDVLHGKRDLLWLFRVAVIARSDLCKILGVFEKAPESELDVKLDISPIFIEFTEQHITRLVKELVDLGVLIKINNRYRLNRDMWRE